MSADLPAPSPVELSHALGVGLGGTSSLCFLGECREPGLWDCAVCGLIFCGPEHHGFFLEDGGLLSVR